MRISVPITVSYRCQSLIYIAHNRKAFNVLDVDVEVLLAQTYARIIYYKLHLLIRILIYQLRPPVP